MKLQTISISLLASLATVASGLAINGAPLDKRAATCSPKAVSIIYDVLVALRASQFCTTWNHVVTSTSTVTAISLTTKVVTTTTTTIPVTSVTSTTSTTTLTTTATTHTNVAPQVTSVGSVATVITTVKTSTSTSVITAYLSTTTAWNFHNKKVKRAAQPSKISALKAFADSAISGACSCYITTPIVTQTQTVPQTSTSASLLVLTSTSTSIVSVETDVVTSVITTVIETTTTPTTVITSTTTSEFDTIGSTVTTTTVQATQTITNTSPIYVDFTFPGCTFVGTAIRTLTGIVASTNLQALDICYSTCSQYSNCLAVTVERATSTSTYTCYLQDQNNSYSNSYYCNAQNAPYSLEEFVIILGI